MPPYAHKSPQDLGSFPITNVVFNIMLALLAMGLFGLLLLHTAKLTNIIRENMTIQAYLHKDISEHTSIHISQLLGGKDFVLKKNGHPQIAFVSKEDAAEAFIQKTGENFLHVLNENPLLDAYIINIDPKYQGQKNLQAIKCELEAINGIFEVEYLENLTAIINKNIAHAGIVLSIFTIILLLVVSVLINNTIKLAIYSQRFLIRSMHLVGATAQFIRKPFLARAILIGLLAGIIADFSLVSLFHYANLHLPSLTQLQEPSRIFMLLAIMPVLGICISFMGTYQAVNKYLYISLDELY